MQDHVGNEKCKKLKKNELLSVEQLVETNFYNTYVFILFFSEISQVFHNIFHKKVKMSQYKYCLFKKKLIKQQNV